MAKSKQDDLPKHARAAFEAGGSVLIGGVAYTSADDLPEGAFDAEPVAVARPGSPGGNDALAAAVTELAAQNAEFAASVRKLVEQQAPGRPASGGGDQKPA